MSETNLDYAKIVGTATDETWSQVHTFFPSDQEKQNKRGQLLAVLSLSGFGEGMEVVAVGREILGRLHEEYFGNLEGPPLARLKQAIGRVAGEVEAPAKVEIGAAVVLGEVLYLAITGSGRAVLLRKGQLGSLLVGSDKIEAVSGYLLQGDLFLLGTAGFFSLVSQGVLRAALATGSPQEAVENLAPVVHSQETGGGEAAVVVKAEGLKEKEEKEAVEKEVLPEREKPGLGFTLKRLKNTLRPFFSTGFNQLNQRGKKILEPFQSRLGKKALYLGKEKPRREQKTVFTVALILFLLLGVSVVLGIRQRSRLAYQEETKTTLGEALKKTEEGKALLDLNPMRSRQLLLEAKEMVAKLESHSGENKELTSFKQELETLLAVVLREHEVKEAPVFLDLNLIKEGAKGDKATITGDQAVILDQKGASVYGVGIREKSSQILAGGKLLEEAQGLAAFGERIFVLTNQGIVEANTTSGEQTLRVKTDSEWGKIVDLFAYGGSLYLLDQKGLIWKYPSLEGGLASGQRWLKGEAKPDFGNASSLAVDGSIWILKKDGVILKYNQGVQEAFGVAGLDKPLADPVALFTNDDLENLYVLDRVNLQVVVINKSGEYDSAYIWPGISGVSDLVVSEAEKKIFLLSGSKIYQIEIK